MEERRGADLAAVCVDAEPLLDVAALGLVVTDRRRVGWMEDTELRRRPLPWAAPVLFETFGALDGFRLVRREDMNFRAG